MIGPSGLAIRTVYNTIRMPYNYVGGNIMEVKWNVMCTQRGMYWSLIETIVYKYKDRIIL